MYQQREPLASETHTRVVSILTLQNLAGGVVGATVGWGVSTLLGIRGTGFDVFWAAQMAIVGVCALAGVVLTIRWSGLSPIERLTLVVFFQIRKLSGGHVVTPPVVTARTMGYRSGLTLLGDDGAVLARPYQTDPPVGEEL